MPALTFLSALALTFERAEQPAGWKDCPTGVQVRLDQTCPSTGPHPAYIYFERNEATFRVRGEVILDFLAEYIRLIRGQGGPDLVYLIEAHTDPFEAETSDLALSRRRAIAVRDYLISKGCPPDAIRILLAGDARPQTFAGGAENEADNRRVMIWTMRR